MTKKPIIIMLVAMAVIAIIAIVGIFKFNFTGSDINIGNPQVADLKNTTYKIEGQNVTLVSGFSETELAPGAASKLVTRYFGNEAIGELNADGQQDTAFILTQEGGGSGTFYYVAAFLSNALEGKNFSGTNTILLGDRIAPQTTEIKDGEIIVNYAERLPGEPIIAAPSVGVSKYFKILNGELVEIVKQTEEGGGAPVGKGVMCREGQRTVDACISLYQPVCATVNIQCIKAPCEPIKQTFGNLCEACRNSLVKSYVEGECPKNVK